MKAHINKAGHRLIVGPGGEPEAAIIPYDDYMAIFSDIDEVFDIAPTDEVSRADIKPGIPAAIARRHIVDGVSLIKAWREHKALTQAEVAKRAGITQAALSKIETSHGRHREATIKKLAVALGVDIEQIRE